MSAVTKNVPLKEGFEQVCVWPATIVGDKKAEFETFFLEETGTRVQFLEEVETGPDMHEGQPVEGTGGRVDVFFAVHNEDVMKFAVPRLSMGIRWIEDVYGNGGGHMYPARCNAYKTW